MLSFVDVLEFGIHFICVGESYARKTFKLLIVKFYYKKLKLKELKQVF